MRYVKIFLLHFQDALHSRARSLVWFPVAFIGPLLLLLFWQGAISEHGEESSFSGCSGFTVFIDGCGIRE